MRKTALQKTHELKFGMKAIILFLAVAASGVAKSQGTDDTLKIRIRPGFFAGAETSIFNSHIITEGIGSVTDMKSVQERSFSGTFETGYFFSGGFGLSTGVGISSFNNTLTLENYSNKFTTKDSENDIYEMRVSGTGIIENQNFSLLRIPVFLNLRIPGRSNLGVFIKAGISMSVPLERKYISRGIFTFTGYYPEFNVLLRDLPDYGFVSDATICDERESELSRYFFEAIAVAGFQFLIANKIQLSVGASYSRSLDDISHYTDQANFQLLSDTKKISSMLGGSYGSRTESIGLNLTVRYFFNGYRVRSKPPQEQ